MLIASQVLCSGQKEKGDERAGRVVEGERRWGSGSLSTAWQQARSHQHQETPDQLFTTLSIWIYRPAEDWIKRGQSLFRITISISTITEQRGFCGTNAAFTITVINMICGSSVVSHCLPRTLDPSSCHPSSSCVCGRRVASRRLGCSIHSGSLLFVVSDGRRRER